MRYARVSRVRPHRRILRGVYGRQTRVCVARSYTYTLAYWYKDSYGALYRGVEITCESAAEVARRRS
jgi:hypothetical protein